MVQSGSSRRRQHRRTKVNDRSDARYREILQAGAQVFRERGYGNTTLQDVADSVGISRPSLYYYVSTKQELLAEILEEPLLEMTRQITTLAKSRAPAAERLRKAILLQMNAFEKYQQEIFIFLAERLYLGYRGNKLEDNSREYGKALARIIKDGQRSGEFRSDIDARVTMLGILGMNNWVHRWYHSDGALTLREIGEQFAKWTLDGIRAQP